MKIRILRSALKDIQRGKKLYEKKEDGLGDYFQSSISADIESLQIYGGIHSLKYGYHRKLCDTFPFAIYYRIHNDEVRIRVHHGYNPTAKQQVRATKCARDTPQLFPTVLTSSAQSPGPSCRRV